MLPHEKQFLEALSKRRQGRVGYSAINQDKALRELKGLLDGGLIIERDFGYGPGFQISDAGRAYLAGES